MTPELSQSPKQLSTIKIPDSDITEAIETTKNEPSV